MKLKNGILVAGAGRVEIDEVHATVRPVAKTPVAATGPGLYRAEGRYYVLAMTPVPKLRVHIPVPILWRDQVPIDFAVRTEPAGHARVAKLIRTNEGFHIAEVLITDIPKGKSLRFFWEGHVLVLPHRPSPLPEGDHDALGASPSPDEVLANVRLSDDIQGALLKLPFEFREAVVLCDVVGLTYDEISGATDVPVGTVKSRIARGRRMLADRLRPIRSDGNRAARAERPTDPT